MHVPCDFASSAALATDILEATVLVDIRRAAIRIADDMVVIECIFQKLTSRILSDCAKCKAVREREK